MPKTPDGRMLVRLNGDPIADAGAIANAILESDADLFVADDRPVLLDNGVLVPVGGKVLLEVLAKHVAVKHLAMNGEKWVVTYTPVTIDQRIISMLLTGRDPRTGEDVKGGTLASRVPKA